MCGSGVQQRRPLKAEKRGAPAGGARGERSYFGSGRAARPLPISPPSLLVSHFCGARRGLCAARLRGGGDARSPPKNTGKRGHVDQHFGHQGVAAAASPLLKRVTVCTPRCAGVVGQRGGKTVAAFDGDPLLPFSSFFHFMKLQLASYFFFCLQAFPPLQYCILNIASSHSLKRA